MTETRLDSPLTLPCGATLPNRLAKAAMSEHLAEFDNAPGAHLETLYRTWSEGGTGLLLTGNVMVDHESLESVRNVILEEGSVLAPFRAWASAGTVAGNHLWMQINHPGRQTSRNINPYPVAPSAVEAVGLFRSVRFFAPPRALTPEEIEQVIARFATTALLAQEAGFTGVQVHGAHGYLVSQFLSPLTNHRGDEWGGSLENRARFARRIVQAIREAVGPAFPVSIKLNSADFQRGGFTHEESMEVVAMLESDGVDLIEISGGSYESQAMFQLAHGQDSTRRREAYFLEYAAEVRARSRVPLMVTGGFRRAKTMRRALAEGACDVIGLARPLAVEPELSRRLLEGSTDGSRLSTKTYGLDKAKLDFLSEGGFSIYQRHRTARGRPPSLDAHVLRASVGSVAYLVQDRVRLGLQRALSRGRGVVGA